MPSFSNSRRVRHSPTDMFDLVADVEKYPAFVPLCERLRIKRRVEAGEGMSVLVADMTVAFGPLRETFTSRVTLNRPELVIGVDYLDGPFSRLDNTWRFVSAGEGSEVRFFIDYEFRNRALALVMGSMFDTAFRRFSDAFVARADFVYGNSARATSP